MYKFVTEDGKYTFINNNGAVTILRYGEVWRDESGDKALLSLLHEIEEMEAYIGALESIDFDTSCSPTPKKIIQLNN